MPKKILIADDEYGMVEMMETALTEEGYEVMKSRDCSHAIAMAYSANPDLIIMDIMMPQIGGVRAFENLKRYSKTENIPVIFITAYPSDELELLVTDLGAAGFIEKPFSMDELLQAIEGILDPEYSI